jgi:hypothetical protein
MFHRAAREGPQARNGSSTRARGGPRAALVVAAVGVTVPRIAEIADIDLGTGQAVDLGFGDVAAHTYGLNLQLAPAPTQHLG